MQRETKDLETPFPISIGIFNLFKNKVKVLVEMLYGNNNLHIATIIIYI